MSRGVTTGPTEDRVKSFFDAGTYLEHNAIIPVRAQIVGRFLADLQGGRVLDLGCGDGSISRPLLRAQNRLTLVDFSPHMLDSARAATDPQAAVEFVQGDLLTFSTNEPYDAVICVGVLAHVPSIDQVMGVIADAVRPGGRCVVQITDDSAPLAWLLNRYYRWRQRARYSLNRMTERELLAAAARRGLVISQSRRYGLLLPGTGRIPYRWQYRAEMTVAGSPTLSRIGTEMLVCLHKPTGSTAR